MRKVQKVKIFYKLNNRHENTETCRKFSQLKANDLSLNYDHYVMS